MSTYNVRKQKSGGFSLVEMLAAVAILVILLSLSAVGVVYYRDYLKITELDNAAREIYMAAENRAVLLKSGEQLDGALSAGDAVTLSEGGAEPSTLRYVTAAQAVDEGLLTAGAIDPALLDGYFYIFYDPSSGAVTDVFYAESDIHLMDQPGSPSAFYTKWSQASRDTRMRPGDAGPMLGYYGGQQAARDSYRPLPAPSVMVEIENLEELTVKVTFDIPAGVKNLKGFQAKAAVKLNYPELEPITLFDVLRPTSSYQDRLVDGGAGTLDSGRTVYTWVLDALRENQHFHELFNNNSLTFGGDFTVTADIELSADGRMPSSASGSDTDNSLFAPLSNGDTARLEYLRHLQNLDAETSRVHAEKTAAAQMEDIRCYDNETYENYLFIPIKNDNLTSYNGGWNPDLEDGKRRRNEILNLHVTEESAKNRDGAGLFSTTKDAAPDAPVTFTGVRLIDAVVKAPQSCGALVGAAGDSSHFKDVRVTGAEIESTGTNRHAGGVVGQAGELPAFQNIQVMDSSVKAKDSAGGIAGFIQSAHDGSIYPVQFQNCRVYWETEGMDHLRDSLGSDKAGYNYQIEGQYAGGLAGQIQAGSSSYDSIQITNCLAASTVRGTKAAGGLVGKVCGYFAFPNGTGMPTQGEIQIIDSYADCYLSGGSSGNAAGLVGDAQAFVELENSYSVGFIDMAHTQKAAGFCLNIDAKVISNNSYTAMYYYGRQEDVDYYEEEETNTGERYSKRISLLSESQFKAESDEYANTYYLDNSGDSLPDSLGGSSTKKASRITYSDLSDASALTTKLGGAFEFKDYRTSTVSQNTYPYNLRTTQTLVTAYPFPGLKGLPHYSDWPAEFKEPSLAYYEKYKDSPYCGFSGGNARSLQIGKLQGKDDETEDPVIEKDGYAVALKQEDLENLADGGVLKITYTYPVTTETGTTKTEKTVTYSVGGTGADAALLDAQWTKEGSTVPENYFLAPLPDELVIGDNTSLDFYQYLRFEILSPGTAEKHPSGEYFYNPHFAETVRPVSDGVLIDWTDADAAEKAGEAVHTYITQNLIPEKSTLGVSIRTPRHLYDLSAYQDYYHNAGEGGVSRHTLAFRQELDLDGAPTIYTGYSDQNLLTHKGNDLVQSPIGTQSAPFLGSYDGGCRLIKNVTFQIPTEESYRVCLGLFGDTKGTLKNIVYELDPNVTQSRIFQGQLGYFGALAGINENQIVNCAVYGVNFHLSPYDTGLFIGGLVGENRGTIQNSAAELADLSVSASTFRPSYAGGLVGQNSAGHSITGSYAVGRLSAKAEEADTLISLCGFAGRNDGSIRNSYAAMDLNADGAGATAHGFCDPSAPGTQSGTYYLNKGNFTYGYGTDEQSFLADYPAERGAQPRTYMELTKDIGVPGMSIISPAADDVFPYPTGVTDGSGAPCHYGKWPEPMKLGKMGVYYWEALNKGGKVSYYVSFLSVGPGENAAAPKTVTKQSTLLTSHDSGGEVTSFGYGLYNQQGVTLKVSSEDLLYSVSGGAGVDFAGWYNPEQKPDSQGALVDQALTELVKNTLEGTFDFHSFHSFGLDGNAGGLYPNATITNPNAALTLEQLGGEQALKVTFILNPHFADAMAVERPDSGGSWTVEGGLTFLEKVNSTVTNPQFLPGRAENPYGVRSIAQLQLIDWNSTNRDVDTIMSDAERAAGWIRTANTFPYLNSANQKTQYHWKQTLDILGERDADRNYKTYTPIAEYYDPSGGDNGILKGWFGGVYDGGGYLIENVNIRGQRLSSCAGLFGVVYNGALIDIILYSSDGRGQISTDVTKIPEGAETPESKSSWFAMGALAGVAGTSDHQDGNAIQNCSAAGYSIEATGFTYSEKVGNGWKGWGGNIIGGLVGASHMNLSGCSAVVDVKLHDITENDNMRVGGLVGSCQGKLTSCYAGGSISIGENVEILRSNDRGIYIGGLVGGSYIKSLKIDGAYDAQGNPIYIGTIGPGQGYTTNETNNTLTNCYSFVTLPSVDSHANLHGLYAIGGTGEIYRGGAWNARKANNHGTCTMTNCYYLSSEVMANNQADGKAGEWTILDNLGQKRLANLNNNNTDWAADERKTDVGYVPGEEYVGYGGGAFTQVLANLSIDGRAVSNSNVYYPKIYTTGSDVVEDGLPVFRYANKSDDSGRWIYTFLGWLVDYNSTSTTWNLTTDRTRFGAVGLTYEQLAGEAGIISNGQSSRIYSLLNQGLTDRKFQPVSKTENGVSVPGKYSYPPRETNPELVGRDYPFPTILTKTNEGATYNVHYGRWPLSGIRREALDHTPLGALPITIDLFGGAEYQEYLVLTSDVTAGGTGDWAWKVTDPSIADAGITLPDSAQEPTNRFLLSVTGKTDGQTSLEITYTKDGKSYPLTISVHVNASVKLRPSTVFLFPGDTAAVKMKPVSAAGVLLEGGTLELQNIYCTDGSNSVDGAPFLSAEITGSTEEAKDTFRFTAEASAPVDASPSLNADFLYTAAPDTPGHMDTSPIQVRILALPEAEFSEEEAGPDGAKQAVATLTFANIPVDDGTGDVLTFQVMDAKPLSSAGNVEVEWTEGLNGSANGNAVTLRYPTAQTPPVQLSVSLTATRTTSGGQPAEEPQSHTLTLTVLKPEPDAPDGQTEAYAMEALPPAGDTQAKPGRQRRARKHPS